MRRQAARRALCGVALIISCYLLLWVEYILDCNHIRYFTLWDIDLHDFADIPGEFDSAEADDL